MENMSVEEKMIWAKGYILSLNSLQMDLLLGAYDMHQIHLKEMEELEAEEHDKEQKKAELEKQQQQQILDLLTSQKPITIDVVRSSVSPVDLAQMSQPITSSSSCGDDDGEITVKDVLLGKMKSTYKSISPAHTIKPYRPRGSRERVYFEEYLYVFDKFSYDSKKKFYRCEKKKTCSARIHTPMDNDRVIHRVQTHNHDKPTAADLAYYDIDFGKLKANHLLPANPPSRIPHSFLTPDPEEENHNPLLRLKQEQKEKQGVCLRLPENFHKCSAMEIHEMEVTLTKYLMRDTELRNELMSDKKALPTFFQDQKIEGLVLFVAKCGQHEDVFEMVKVPEKTELSIRNALQDHFQETTSRKLMVNVSAKIKVPLNQQMIDQWKSEEFIRVDTSKPTSWKIFQVNQID